MPKYVHTPDYSTSRDVSNMAEEIATINNSALDLRGQVAKLEGSLKHSRSRIRELEELIVELQEECSTLQLKLKKKAKRGGQLAWNQSASN